MMVVMTAALLAAGTAHADGRSNSGPDFDRVGRVAAAKPQAPGERSAAPGESLEASVTSYPARKREMARRLVWLMLSAR
jgi:hypothetical protein